MNVSVLVYRSLCVWRFYMCFCLTVSASVFLLVSVSVIQDLVAFHQLRFHLIKYTGDDLVLPHAGYGGAKETDSFTH